MTRLHHVALLVESLEALLPSLAARGWASGPINSYPKEGTREAYVGAADPAAEPYGRLLLVQSAGAGPYARALSERGPGLHHLGLAVPDLSAFAAALPASGWYVHPFSLRGGAQLRRPVAVPAGISRPDRGFRKPRNTRGRRRWSAPWNCRWPGDCIRCWQRWAAKRSSLPRGRWRSCRPPAVRCPSKRC